MTTLANVMFAICLSGVCLGMGGYFVRQLDSRRILDPVEALSSAFVIGSMLVAFAVWAVGVFRLDGLSMAVTSVVLGFVALPGMRMQWACFSRPVFSTSQLCLVWLIALLAVANILGALAPPSDFDSLNYHLSLPRRDLELGRIEATPGMVFSFFPPLVEMLARLGMALVDDRTPQIAHALFGLAASGMTYAIGRRWGGSRTTGLVAAAIFLSVRGVVWESGTAQVELALAAAFGGVLLTYRLGLDNRSPGLFVLAGLLLGAAANIKYIAFVFALGLGAVMLWDLFRRRITPFMFFVIPVVTLALLLPLLAQNALGTGNPVFPLFHDKIVADAINPYEGMGEIFGRERSLLNLLRGPWDVFIVPTWYFDGQVFGPPIILAFLPVVFLLGRGMGGWWREWTVMAVYYVVWYYVLSQQIRFFLPVLPVLCALTAMGIWLLWDQTKTRPWCHRAMLAVLVVFSLNQALFVGIYGLLRYPAALGLQSRDAYLSSTLNGGLHEDVCREVSERLRPGERYIAVLDMYPHFCPQLPMIANFLDDERPQALSRHLPPLTRQRLIDAMRSDNVALVVVLSAIDARASGIGVASQETPDLGAQRLGKPLIPALETLRPLVVGRRAVIYDGRQVLEELERLERRDTSAVPAESKSWRTE